MVLKNKNTHILNQTLENKPKKKNTMYKFYKTHLMILTFDDSFHDISALGSLLVSVSVFSLHTFLVYYVLHQGPCLGPRRNDN